MKKREQNHFEFFVVLKELIVHPILRALRKDWIFIDKGN
jgi:hypothetical protein